MGAHVATAVVATTNWQSQERASAMERAIEETDDSMRWAGRCLLITLVAAVLGGVLWSQIRIPPQLPAGLGFCLVDVVFLVCCGAVFFAPMFGVGFFLHGRYWMRKWRKMRHEAIANGEL